MRLPLIAIAGGLVATLAASLHAEPSLPARSFAPVPTAVPVIAVPVTADPDSHVRVPRVRPTDQRIRAVVRIGLERSTRVRSLVERVESGNVVAHISMDARMGTGLAGRLTFVGAAGGFRYVRVRINPDQTSEQAIAALAHELQHVVELGEHPGVVSEADLSGLYQRIGHSNRAGSVLGWETTAAQDVSLQVRRELTLGAAAARRQSSRPADPSGR
jgi:hypothetical protein